MCKLSIVLIGVAFWALGSSTPSSAKPTLSPLHASYQNGFSFVSIGEFDTKFSAFHFEIPDRSSMPPANNPYSDPASIAGNPQDYAVCILAPAPNDFALSLNQPGGLNLLVTDEIGDRIPVMLEELHISPVGRYYCALIPGGQPDSVTSLELTLSVGGIKKAEWQLENLPKAARTQAVIDAVESVTTIDGTTLKGRAWRAEDSYPSVPTLPLSAEGQIVSYQLTASPPAPGKEFQFQVNSVSFDGILVPLYFPMNYGYWPGGSHQSELPPLPLSDPTLSRIYFNVSAPYSHGESDLRLEGSLIEQSYEDETVTFHNLTFKPITVSVVPPTNVDYNKWPRATEFEVDGPEQTVTTPNGLSVTLVSYSSLNSMVFPDKFAFNSDVGAVRLALSISPPAIETSESGEPVVMLPESRFYQEHFDALALSFRAIGAYTIDSRYGLDFSPGEVRSGYHVLMLQPLNKPGSVSGNSSGRSLPEDISIVIRETGNVDCFPLSFKLPILNSCPPDLMSAQVLQNMTSLQGW